MSTNKNTTDRLAFSPVEAAQLIGVSLGTLRALLASGQLPHRRAHKRILISRSALETFLAGEQGVGNA